MEGAGIPAQMAVAIVVHPASKMLARHHLDFTTSIVDLLQHQFHSFARQIYRFQHSSCHIVFARPIRIRNIFISNIIVLLRYPTHHIQTMVMVIPVHRTRTAREAAFKKVREALCATLKEQEAVPRKVTPTFNSDQHGPLPPLNQTSQPYHSTEAREANHATSKEQEAVPTHLPKATQTFNPWKHGELPPLNQIVQPYYDIPQVSVTSSLSPGAAGAQMPQPQLQQQQQQPPQQQRPRAQAPVSYTHLTLPTKRIV